MEIIKIKRTIEFFQATCKCGKIITGTTKNEVAFNMGVHGASKNCKNKSK